MSLFLGEITYYYYELGDDLFGVEKYYNGIRTLKRQYDSQEFLYIYARDLGLEDEIREQVSIVKRLMDYNGILNVEDIDDLEDLVDENGYLLGDFIYDETWFFDSNGIKPYIQGG